MNHLRAYRKSLGLTQEGLAEILGCRQAVISEIECEKRALPADVAVVIFIDSMGSVPLKILRPEIYNKALRIAKYRLDKNLPISDRGFKGEEAHGSKVN